MTKYRDLLVDGIFLALPLGAAAFLIVKAIGLFIRLLAPAMHLLPEGRAFSVRVEDGAFHQLLAKLGSPNDALIVLEATGGALPGQDRDCVKLIERSLKKQGIKLLTEVVAQGFEQRPVAVGCRGQLLEIRAEQPHMISLDDRALRHLGGIVLMVGERVMRLGNPDLRVGTPRLLAPVHERRDARQIRLKR